MLLLELGLGMLAIGPPAAGFYQIAVKIGMILAQPVLVIGQSLYPELSQLVADKPFDVLRRVVMRTGLIAAMLVLLPILFGLLHLYGLRGAGLHALLFAVFSVAWMAVAFRQQMPVRSPHEHQPH